MEKKELLAVSRINRELYWVNVKQVHLSKKKKKKERERNKKSSLKAALKKVIKEKKKGVR